MSGRDHRPLLLAALLAVFVIALGVVAGVLTSPLDGDRPRSPARTTEGVGGPWHTDIVVTTFWIGEVFDPQASDGSQIVSTYDAQWLAHYGGCDGLIVDGRCQTTARDPADGWYPPHMTPGENPFYLDLPYDDLHDAEGFARRCEVIPWAPRPDPTGRCTDPDVSFMKNRWVHLVGPSGRDCYGQIEDAGPGEYADARYVFGADDARPRNQRYGGAGLDVSPALNGCLGLRELDGSTDRVSWRHVPASRVPDGPWRWTVTTSGVTR